MAKAKQIMVFLLIGLIVSIGQVVAEDITMPQLPLTLQKPCISEENHCGYLVGSWKSNQPLKLYAAAMMAQPDTQLPAKTSFVIQENVLYTTSVATFKVKDPSLCVDEQTYAPVPEIKPGAVVHQVAYGDEGSYRVLYGQRFLLCDFWDKPWEKIQGELRTESWYKILYNKQTYWWQPPSGCDQPYEKPASCPILLP